MKKLLLAVAIIVFVLVGVFLLFNFRLMRSQTVSNSTTAASNAGSDIKDWTFSPENTGLYVEGESRYVQRLRDQLTRLLNGHPKIGSVSAINLPADKADIPVLYITIKQQKKTWTPIVADSAYEVIVSYATNGDVSFRGTDPVTFVNTSEKPAIRFQSNFAIADRSVGLISMPGYDDYIVNVIADAVQKNLQEQLKSQ